LGGSGSARAHKQHTCAYSHTYMKGGAWRTGEGDGQVSRRVGVWWRWHLSQSRGAQSRGARLSVLVPFCGPGQRQSWVDGKAPRYRTAGAERRASNEESHLATRLWATTAATTGGQATGAWSAGIKKQRGEGQGWDGSDGTVSWRARAFVRFFFFFSFYIINSTNHLLLHFTFYYGVSRFVSRRAWWVGPR
jgi:hypothetical protein